MKRYVLLLALLLALTGPLNALAEVFPEPQIVLEPDEAEIEVVLPPAEEEVSPGDAEPYEEEIVLAAEELPLFDITDGVLRAYNGAEAEVILPEEVAVIAAGAFEGNHILESVTAGDALTAIEDGAFLNCDALTTLRLPAGVHIGEAAFEGCGEVAFLAPDAVISRAALTITQQPKDVLARSGDRVTFSVSAAGTGLRYQWQYRDADTGWFVAPSAYAQQASWSFEADTAMDGRYYRCVIIDADGAVTTSRAALLTVPRPPVIRTQPKNITAASGELITISLDVTGTQLSWQWQYMTPEEGKWRDCAGEIGKAESMTFTARSDFDGRMYRCVVTDGVGQVQKSNRMTLHVTGLPAPALDSLTASATSIVVRWPAAPGAKEYRVYRGETSSFSDAAQVAVTRSLKETVTGLSYGKTWYFWLVALNDWSVSLPSAPLSLTLAPPPVIRVQPGDLTLNAAQKGSVSIGATGSGLAWQWERANASGGWDEVPGATSATLQLTGTMAENGAQYRCVIRDAIGNVVKSNRMTLTVLSVDPPRITLQSKGLSLYVGQAGTLSVKAEGMQLTYQWQTTTAGSNAWTNLSGATASALTLTPALSDDGRQYRCVVTDIAGQTAKTGRMTLTVTQLDPPRITQQSKGLSLYAGLTGTLSVKAEGTQLTYQWQTTTAGSNAWTNLPGATASALTLTPALLDDGRQYRCVVTDIAGQTAKTGRMTLTVTQLPAPVFTKQPEDTTLAAGCKLTLLAQAQGEELQYQWQYRDAGGASWVNCAGEAAKAPSLTFTVRPAWNGRQYRCQATDALGQRTASNAATLTVTDLPAPALKALKAEDNAIRVSWDPVEGAASYTVYYSAEGKTEGAKTLTANGVTERKIFGLSYDATYTVWVQAVNSYSQSGLSAPMTLLLIPKPVIEEQWPGDRYVPAGWKTELGLYAEGRELQYQWQYYNGSQWVDAVSEDAKDNWWEFTVKQSMDGRQYRCAVTDAAGNRVYSDVVTLRVMATVETELSGWLGKSPEAFLKAHPELVAEYYDEEDGCFEGNYVDFLAENGKISSIDAHASYYSIDGISAKLTASQINAQLKKNGWILARGGSGYYWHYINAEGLELSMDDPDSMEDDSWISINVLDEVPDLYFDDRDGHTFGIHYYEGVDTTFTLPSTHDGKPVTTIGEGCFCGSEALTSVIVPVGYTTIEAKAFRDLPSLTSVTIASSVKSIDKNAFSGCHPIIRGIRGSYAEKWAKANGYTFKESTAEVAATALTMSATLSLTTSKKTLTPVFTPSNTDNRNLTWESSNPIVAEVNANGTVKPVNSGTAVITATTDNGITASCTVTVNTGINYELSGYVGKTFASLKKAHSEISWERINDTMFALDDTLAVELDDEDQVNYIQMRQGCPYKIHGFDANMDDDAVESRLDIGKWKTCFSSGNVSYYINSKNDCFGIIWYNGATIIKSKEEMFYDDGFPFKLREKDDGEWEISEYKGGEENLIIPATTPWGEPIVSIGEDCLVGNEAVKTVTIESGICQINKYAFGRCSNLTDIYIPASVTWIGVDIITSMWPTIHGVRGSYAQSWAEDEGYTFKPGKIS